MPNEGYYKDVHDEKLVIDTSRMWCSKMPMIANLYPNLTQPNLCLVDSWRTAQLFRGELA